MKLLTETYKEDISMKLSCYDRILLCGTLSEISYGRGMTEYLYDKSVKIFDYPKFAEPFKEAIRWNAERISAETGVSIEFIRKSGIRKESIISEKIKARGTSPGLVHILSVMEGCNTFKPWHDKATGKTFLKPDVSKCLHYYFYLIDPELGLCYVRVPSWLPCRLQVYINGHNLLASKLEKEKIGYTMLDNAFDSIEDVKRAQELSDDFDTKGLHRKLDELAWRFCPIYKEFGLRYHWNVEQAEYATDIVFKKQDVLQSIYSELVKTAIHTVKPENIATFLGQKLAPQYKGEVGNNYNVRIEGSRIKHTMGKSSIKMYDKFSKILRIETTTNHISFFKHFREVVHRDGTRSNKVAPLKKNIYSLSFLQENLNASNNRYLEFISAFDNKDVGRKRLEEISTSKEVNNRRYKGFNFFNANDLRILLAILQGEFNITGFKNKNLQKQLNLKSSQISRILKRLHVHGLIKKVGKTYKYYVTLVGKNAIIMAQKIKELVIIPELSF